jgi:two component transcriptional regulator, winged helix family
MYDKIKEILKDVKLMIVEDDNLLRNCLKDSIRYYVKEIYDFQNTKSALDMFGKTDINLIITDINMPGINGLKMASLIR